MSCSPFDLRDFYLKELTDPQQRQVEAHVRDCSACREELEQLRLTQAALFSLRDEEIPQRIAFVSDPVFEPSAPRRWWNAFWGSSARLGFTAAAMLSAALLVSTVARTAAPAAGVSSVEVDQRIQQAIYASEARQNAKTTQLVHDLAEKADHERQLRVAAEDEVSYAKKEMFAMELKAGEYITPASN
jgi:anti-sigma factor RsiW